jgi:tetratricopeptide (TPR) repeat protein
MVAFYDADYQEAARFLQQSVIGIDDKKMVEDIHRLCGDIYNVLHDYDQAEQEYLAALQAVPQHLYSLLQIIGIKQQGKSKLSWQDISNFTTPLNNKKLQLSLTKQGELQLVLIIALLNIINGHPDSHGQIANCSDYLQGVMQYRPVDEMSKIVIDYLKISAEMIALYAKSDCIRCPLLAGTASIDNIVSNNLDLIIKTLCPSWIPCFILH